MIIIRNYPSVYRHCTTGTRIYPGTNHIPNDKAATLINDPDFLRMEKSGAFTIQREKVPEDVLAGNTNVPAENVSEAVKAMNAKQAVEFVKGCLILDTLKQLQEDETRASVLSAIEKQIVALTPVPNPENNGDA